MHTGRNYFEKKCLLMEWNKIYLHLRVCEDNGPIPISINSSPAEY